MNAEPPRSLRNLGPDLGAWLKAIGVESADELRALGSLEAWRRLRFAVGSQVGLAALCALDGALSGHDRRRLPPGRREELRRLARDAARLGP